MTHEAIIRIVPKSVRAGAAGATRVQFVYARISSRASGGFEVAVMLRPFIRLARLIGGGGRQRRQRSIALLKSSPLFDKDWYDRKYPDVRGAGIDPAWHYIEFGWREGRDPGPLFSTNDYIRSNPDVARSGSNPLLHFLEFGYAEGRGTSKHRAVVLSAKSPGEPFGPAAPCFSSPLPEEAPVRWRRSARFNLAAGDLQTIDGLPIGLVSDPDQRTLIDAAFKSLRALSGYGGALPSSVSAQPSPRGTTLLDCWFTNHGRLRTRWKSEPPIVVRAYQHDTSCDGKLRMVAEGLSGTNVDCVDASLCNPYFPVLFVMSEPQGTVSETQLLAFPSLCRGGIHYSELLAISGKPDAGRQALDPIGHGQALTDRLLALFPGDRAPLVGALSIDLAGADGSRPLFQPDFRAWLARVARIGIGAPEPSQRDRGGTFLASTVELSVPGTRDPSRGILILSGEMVPTVSVLTSAVSPGGEEPIDTRLSLIVPGSEPSQPATLFEHPPIDTDKLQSGSSGYPPIWPRLIEPAQGGLLDQRIPAAIRLPSRPALADAELLLPVSGMPSPGPMQTITWLIWADRWKEDMLARAIESLSLQTGARRFSIAFIGETKTDLALLASQFSASASEHIRTSSLRWRRFRRTSSPTSEMA